MKFITLIIYLCTLNLSNAFELSFPPRNPEPELFPSNWAPFTPRFNFKPAQASHGTFAPLARLASPSSTDSHNDNGPELDNAPEAGLSFSSLTARYERRQGCPGGYGSCNKYPDTCCPIGGDCCGNNRCCDPGKWCYTSIVCCKRGHSGCDNKVHIHSSAGQGIKL